MSTSKSKVYLVGAGPKGAPELFEKKPLFGQKILVTRVETKASNLSEKLSLSGAKVLHYPTVSIQPPSSWEPFDKVVSSTIAMDWVIFTSTNGIDGCMKRLQNLEKDIRVFASAKIACVGQTSAEHLKKYGLIADVVPQLFQSEGLIDSLKEFDFREKTVWLPQAEVTRGLLQKRLEEWGANLYHTPVYKNELPDLDYAPLVQELDNQNIDWITFTSPSAIKNFIRILPAGVIENIIKNTPRIACIGESTAEAARQNDLTVEVVPKQQNIDGLVAAICDTCQDRYK